MTNLTDEGLMDTAAIKADWGQVVANGGPPCFHICSDKQFCLRAEGWFGHPEHHAFISLATLLKQVRDAAKKEERERAAVVAENYLVTNKQYAGVATAIRQMDGGK